MKIIKGMAVAGLVCGVLAGGTAFLSGVLNRTATAQTIKPVMNPSVEKQAAAFGLKCYNSGFTPKQCYFLFMVHMNTDDRQTDLATRAVMGVELEKPGRSGTTGIDNMRWLWSFE